MTEQARRERGLTRNHVIGTGAGAAAAAMLSPGLGLDKAFAAGVDRHEVAEGLRMLEEASGGTDEEHLARILAVLHEHREELGLLPPQ